MPVYNGTTGNDTLTGGSGADTLNAYGGNDQLNAGSGNDLLYGGDGSDTLYGAGGNDSLTGGAGADALVGGTGTDTADYAASGAGVTVNLTTGVGTGGDADGDVLSQIESILGSSYADLLTGDGNANTLTGGAGEDSLYGGAGGDSLYGGDGNDLMRGGAGSDRLEGGAGIDSADYSDSTAAVSVNLAGGAGSGGTAAGDTLVAVENIFGSIYNDALYGSTAGNVLSGGLGNDYIDAGAGDDTLAGGAGRDTLYGGEGMDFLDYRESNAAVSINLTSNTASGGHATGDVLQGVDGIIGSAFDDTLIGFDNQGLTGDVYTNIFFGGAGNDYMDVGAGNDIVHGDEGNDTVIAGAGDDSATGGDGNDAVYGGTGNDSAYGGGGADLVDGGAGNDLLDGGLGADSLYGGTGNDAIYGGDGNDLISGGAGNDLLTGGTGSDTFVGGIGDTVVGGAGDNDVLDLSGSTPYRILKNPNDHTSGVVQFLDAFGNVIGTLSYSGIDSGIACFTPGAMMETAAGPRAIETLQPGDLVLTRDRGLQPIRWIGKRTIPAAELQVDPALHPILFRKGALGPNLPNRDMMVSRQHCMLAEGPRAALYFGEDEVFVRALHMAGQPGIVQSIAQEVTYLHLMFDHHEVIRADGVWSESFLPAARNIGGLEDAARAELFKVFAEMPEGAPPEGYQAARLILKSHEARLLLSADPALRRAA